MLAAAAVEPPALRTPEAAESAVMEVKPTFDDVYREHAAFIWRSVRRLGLPDDGLEDAVQEIFLVVHRRIGDYEERTTMRAWLYAIVLHVVRTHRRRWRRKGFAGPGGTEGDVSHVADKASVGPQARAEQAEAVRLLYELLEAFDEDRREVFVLSELEQLTVPEIAEILGVNLNTVYWRLRMARQEFEAALARRRAGEKWRGL